MNLTDLHPNWRRLTDEQTFQKSRSIIIELKQTTQRLTQKDLAKWRRAWQVALDVENPKRIDLYDIYTDAMMDNHLIGVTGQRKRSVMRKRARVVDAKSGKENPEQTRLLQMPWFLDFCNIALDASAWGHSLIQFGDIIMVNTPTGDIPAYKEVKLVPRKHVIPEFHVFVKEMSDEPAKGFDYTKGAFADWCIEVGKPDDLGFLLPISPNTISKKYAGLFWDQFAEIFGIPIRVAKTSSREAGVREKIENMLTDMGAATWALFPEGTEIDVKEAKQGDSFNVFDKRIERANSEISKGVVGQTMTTDNGASRSQSEVHERVAEDITEEETISLEQIVNMRLFPMMIKHGFKMEGGIFEFDRTSGHDLQTIINMEQNLLNHYEIDPEYFVKRYGIPVIKPKTQVQQFAFGSSFFG